MGMFAGALAKAIFLDDRPESVEYHLELARSALVEPIVHDNLVSFRLELDKISQPTILFLDAHMKNVRDLGDAGFGEIRTDDGENVGPAIIRGMLPKLGLENIPVYVLSGYTLAPSAIKSMKTVRARGRVTDFIEKDAPEKFKRILDAHRLSALEFVHSELKAAISMVKEWTSSEPAQAGRIFGYVESSTGDWQEKLGFFPENATQDILDRSRLIVGIKECLVRLFGTCDNISSEISFLKEPDSSLGGQSPWALMFGGHLHDLALVAGLFRKMAE